MELKDITNKILWECGNCHFQFEDRILDDYETDACPECCACFEQPPYAMPVEIYQKIIVSNTPLKEPITKTFEQKVREVRKKYDLLALKEYKSTPRGFDDHATQDEYFMWNDFILEIAEAHAEELREIKEEFRKSCRLNASGGQDGASDIRRTVKMDSIITLNEIINKKIGGKSQ